MRIGQETEDRIAAGIYDPPLAADDSPAWQRVPIDDPRGGMVAVTLALLAMALFACTLLSIGFAAGWFAGRGGW